MPIFLARTAAWGALIRADDLDHACHILDEVVSPLRCEVMEYEGPLVFEFSFPVVVTDDPRGGENLVIPETPLPLDFNRLPYFEEFEGESGIEMRASILEHGFPDLFKLRKAWFETGDRDSDGWGAVESSADKSAFGMAVANQVGWWNDRFGSREKAPPDPERDRRRVRECRARILAEQVLQYVSCGALEGAREIAKALLEELDEETETGRSSK